MAGTTTRRVVDNSSVPFLEAIAAWTAAARPVLVRVAQTYGAYITYAELADAVQEAAGVRTGSAFRNWIGRVLGEVARHPDRPEEPMLTALVVHADGTIGPGYAEPVRDRDGEVPDDLDVHAAHERLACYRYFGAAIPADGGVPMLTRQLAEKRRSHARPAVISRRVCPTCFLQLPFSGRCDTCDGG